MTNNNERNTIEYWYKISQSAFERIILQERVINDLSKMVRDLEFQLLDLKRKIKENNY